MIEVTLSLGSNLGDKESNIKNAIKLLSDNLVIYKVSEFFYSKALLPDGAPESWDVDFVNVAVLAYTDRAPLDLLDTLLSVELLLGRDAKHKKWSPRIIDIDLLLYDNFVINIPRLVIPHPEMLKREFVVEPLRQITR